MEFQDKVTPEIIAEKTSEQWCDRLCHKFNAWLATGNGNEFWSYFPTDKHAAFSALAGAGLAAKGYTLEFEPDVVKITV